ncbi:hypothetical protein K8B33_07755 [Alcanivorax sp. JB21]|uniref:hypothetical protein n=1 Tax=Alcanivorax limicola TaxID=2874102 RepID=UPI001CC047AC|nr:hypothetical protein [Alcanivorax limicola]MBZ2188987.1 hypothetical protein [Alcanivorax limicola]
MSALSSPLPRQVWRLGLLLSLLMSAITLTACGGGGGGNGGDPAATATFDTPIEDLAITEVVRGSGGFPVSTAVGEEPVIRGVETFESPDGMLVMEFIIESLYPITRLHIDIEGEHFVSPTRAQAGPEFSIDACDVLASVQGTGCSERCWRAASCIRSCSGTLSTFEAQESAALQCSIAVNVGVIGPGESDVARSEEEYVRLFYTHGPDNDPSMTVLSASGTVCDVSSCPSVAETCWASGYGPTSETICIPAGGEIPTERHQIAFAPSGNFDFLPETSGVIVVPQSNPPGETLTGGNFAPGTLSQCSLSSGAGAQSPCNPRTR